jgi:hypothetical protein
MADIRSFAVNLWAAFQCQVDEVSEMKEAKQALAMKDKDCRNSRRDFQGAHAESGEYEKAGHSSLNIQWFVSSRPVV